MWREGVCSINLEVDSCGVASFCGSWRELGVPRHVGSTYEPGRITTLGGILTSKLTSS